MPSQRLQTLALIQIPNSNRHVIGATHQLFIAQQLYALNIVFMSLERFGANQRLQIPNFYCFVIRATDQLISARQLQIPNRLVVSNKRKIAIT